MGITGLEWAPYEHYLARQPGGVVETPCWAHYGNLGAKLFIVPAHEVDPRESLSI